MAEGTISAALRECMRLNLLSYSKRPKRRSNLYTIHKPEVWRLPPKIDSSASNSYAENDVDHCNKREPEELEFEGEGLQNLKTRKTNSSNNNLSETHLGQHQDKMNRSETDPSSLSKAAKEFFAETVIEFYRSFSVRFNKKKYLVEHESELMDEVLLDSVLTEYFNLVQLGGSLDGWIRNEFCRLQGKKTIWIPRPEFLGNKASIKSYKSMLHQEFEIKESIEDMIGNLPKEQFLAPLKEDPVYKKCRLTAEMYLTSPSSVHFEYERLSTTERNLYPIGINVFLYLLLKENVKLPFYSREVIEALHHYCSEVNYRFELPNQTFKFVEGIGRSEKYHRNLGRWANPGASTEYLSDYITIESEECIDEI